MMQVWNNKGLNEGCWQKEWEQISLRKTYQRKNWQDLVSGGEERELKMLMRFWAKIWVNNGKEEVESCFSYGSPFSALSLNIKRLCPLLKGFPAQISGVCWEMYWYVSQHLNSLSLGWVGEECHLTEWWLDQFPDYWWIFFFLVVHVVCWKGTTTAFQEEQLKHTMLGSVLRMIHKTQKIRSVQLTKWKAEQSSLFLKSIADLLYPLDIHRKSRSMRLKYPANSFIFFQLTLLMWQWWGWGNELGPQTLQYLILFQSFPWHLLVTLSNCPAFQKVPQARISRSCLALAIGCSVVSQLVSPLKKEKETGWLGEEVRGERKE